MKKKAAVIPAAGIGDGLLMMITAHQLHKAGYDVTIFHNQLQQLKEWAPDYTFHSYPPLDQCDKLLSGFSLTIAENDNKERLKQLRAVSLRKKLPLAVFYPTYKMSKHGPLRKMDTAFDPTLSMAENIGTASSKLLNRKPDFQIGLQIPENLKYRQFLTRVAIHPTSGDPKKDWPKKKYFILAKKLQRQGYAPAFCISPTERAKWLFAVENGIDVPLFPSLSHLGSYLYESGYFIGNDSGTGHLASYLNIPNIILADNADRMQLWRPGWRKGEILTPLQWIPNFKGFRLREKSWQSFVSISRVLHIFQALSKKS